MRKTLIGSIFCSCTLLASGCFASEGLTLSAPETKELEQSVLDELRRSDDLSQNHSPSIHWLSQPQSLRLDRGFRLIGLAQIKFEGLSNSYCRLVSKEVVADKKPLIVNLPDSENHDTCSGARSAYSFDLDGDGELDFFYTIKVASNRYPQLVEEVVVFLGTGSQVDPYCYSKEASRAVEPSASMTPSRAKAAIFKELSRSRKKRFACDRL